MPSFNFAAVESKWQQFWESHKTFATPDTSDRPKYYILDMFPYPSGSGLHVGHPEGYTATDILARYKRMTGFNVLHPMGWDAFGLPAEQYAIETGTHPRLTTQKNIDTFRRQIKMLGFSYDWDREVDTTDPKYFKWTQWIFLLLYDTWYDPDQKKGRPISELPIPDDVKGAKAIREFIDEKRLAYQTEAPVNWCPYLGTVLSNEEVVDGKSERGGHPVERRPLLQWMLRITAYADRLLHDLEQVDWSESIKEMQRNWIGRSEGAEVDFALAMPDTATDAMKRLGASESIRVFTTRPDTLYGATYMVLSPEHPLVPKITTKEQQKAVKKYQSEAARKSDFERTEMAKQKTGVFTGAFAINPVNGEQVPIWIADYVLAGYGTGAIMAVPAHDLRDWEFARAFSLPIRPVVKPPDGYRYSKEEEALAHEGRMPFAGEGTAINSGEFDGLPTAEFKATITARLEQQGKGQKKVNTKLRDWLFSRQRYWGEPFPILHKVNAAGKPTGEIYPVLHELLPLRLPEMEDFKPSGNPEPPLSKAQDWVNVQCGDKITFKRETNTMPQWAGSCWYYLRYIDPHNDQAFCDPAKAKDWLPVDLYVGGAEHAVLHLLYSRFWHKVLFDRGHVPCPEPFQRLVNQGMILGVTYFITPEVYRGHEAMLTRLKVQAKADKVDGNEAYILGNPGIEPGQLAPLKERQIEEKDGKFYLAESEIEISAHVEKMSKSRGNVINPDDVVRDRGADSLRLYEMFMGPLEATKPWSTRGVEGVFRFLNRVWRLIIDDQSEEMRLASSVREVEPDRDTARKLHQTIRKVTQDLDGMQFNTAISAMMELSNHLQKLEVRPKSVLNTFVLLLSPFAPHIAEELWQALGHDTTLAYEPWPKFDPALVAEDAVEILVQINSKKKHTLTVPPQTDKAALQSAVLADETVKGLIEGKPVKTVIVVPGKLVNIVLAN